MDQLTPIRLEKTETRELFIEWSDGRNQVIPFRQLRDGCQCATCEDKRTKGQTDEKNGRQKGELPVLSAEQARPLDIESMRPVGNYAYNIQFNDGHSTGIFTFELLRSFSK